MNKYIKIIKLLLIIFSLSSIAVFFMPTELFKDFGNISWYFLILVMFIRPLHDIFPKCKVFSFLLKFRREYGILMAVFAIAHGFGAFMMYKGFAPEKSYVEMFFESYVWDYTGYMFWGMIAGIISVPLLITSNGISTQIMGKHWKTLQKFSYIVFPFSAIHIAIIHKNRIEYGPLLVIGIWLILMIIAGLKNKKMLKNSSSGPKWLCVPCGYIYDENIGDPDSGIAPGTRFEDIPQNWRCPVCGVGKNDFILVSGKTEINESIINSIKYLTSDVIELKIETKKDFEFTPGQFITFSFNDGDSNFNRSYSIANKVGNIYTFLIKLKKDGKAGILLRNKKNGDILKFTNISGNFKLKNSQNPKVFIATGTGLSPIYNMILNTPENISKKIFFGVANIEDIFYVEELKKFKNLEINLYLSRQKIEGYNYGRMNFENIHFEENSEFYICGNPGVVESAKKALNEKGFNNVYSEKF